MRTVWDILQARGAYQAAAKRYSERTYDGKALDDAAWEDLHNVARELSMDGVRIELQPQGGQEVMKGFFGTRSKITGVCAYAAVIAKDGADAALAGYLGEAFVLACTASGLNTVWIGGTMDKKKISSLLLQPGEKLYCVTPVGKAASGQDMPPRKRMTMEKLTGMDEQQLAALQPWQRDVMECVRIAPSAMNKQPWKCDVQGEAIRVLVRCANFGFEHFDTGLARLHRDAALLAAGKPALGHEQ